MPDFNPKDIDALFREGAERHEFDYNSDSWTLMEEKLDKKEGKKRFLFFLLGLVLLVAVIGLFSYLNFNKDMDKEAIATTSILNEKVKEQNEIQSTQKDVVEIPSKNTLNSNTQPKVQEEYISTDSKEGSGNIGAQNSFQSENTGNLIGNEIVSIDSQTESVHNDHQKNNNIIIDENKAVELIKKLQPIKPQAKIEYLNITSLVNKDFEMFDTGNLGLESFNLKPSKTPTTPILLTTSNRFTLTVFANPEWSSVGLFQESKVGWSVGAKVGYQFADKFEVSTGIAFSRKIYKGAGAEYTMEGGWMKDIEPMRMDAKCDVIEIPIGLSYYINGFRKSGFFTDLGINSYMLHSEWYGFKYDDALVRPPEFMEVNKEDENTHLVGVGRFAIGYQKVLSNNTSLQIAPYLQFPLTGIGAGQVNLYSTGVQFAVKFNTQ